MHHEPRNTRTDGSLERSIAGVWRPGPAPGVKTVLSIALVGLGSRSASAGDLHIPDEYPDLASAVLAAESGDTIVFAPGTYAVNEIVRIDDPTVGLFESLTIRGDGTSDEGPAVTLDGGGLGRILDIQVDSFPSDRSIRIENIRFINGVTEADPDDSVFERGGGAVRLHCAFGTIDAAIVDCVFEDNACEGFIAHGGAVHASYVVNTTVSGCRFTGNRVAGTQARGGGLSLYGPFQVHDCLFQGNHAEGDAREPSGVGGGFGAAFHTGNGAVGTIGTSQFIGNTAVAGGAILVTSFAEVEILSSRFEGNEAIDHLGTPGFGGAIVASSSSLALRDSEVVGNAASLGGGISISASTLDLEASLVRGNIAGDAGGSAGGIRFDDASMVSLETSSVCGNTPFQVSGPVQAADGSSTYGICDDLFPEDLDDDGRVNAAELGAVLAAWGTSDIMADFNGDGLVGGADLARILAAWTVPSLRRAPDFEARRSLGSS